MTTTLEAIRQLAVSSPRRPAVRSATAALDYGALLAEAETIARAFEARDIAVAALAADNGVAWLAVDLAAQIAGTAVVPIPPYFSGEQIAHVLDDSGADALLAGPELRTRRDLELGAVAPFPAGGAELAWTRLRTQPIRPLPGATAKITYTSGTTGRPKGVCLPQASMDTVARSLQRAVASLSIARHLCVLPLATLLENIAGVYAPWLAGAEVVVPSAVETGLAGAARFDASTLLRCLERYQPDSIILVPQLLAALVAALESGAAPPASLKLVAVGGGHVAPGLLARADRLGLPVYEGYGLTECASVVALNTPEARRIGSVGKPLPHVELTVDSRGEIHVGGPALGRYLGDAHPVSRFATGDLGYVDADGFLHLNGRRKNLFITSYGRNVSPEWVEAELCDERAIVQAAVFGESRPWNVAVLVPAPTASAEQIATAVHAANCRLPDYARVGDFIIASEPFAPANAQLTTNGRNRRTAIWSRYGARLDALYDEQLERTA